MSVTVDESELPVAEGAIGGVVAYLVGYLVAYVWLAADVERTLRGFNFVVDLLGGEPIPTWKAVGWLFYNAHFVATSVPAGPGGSVSRNFVDAAGGDIALLYAVPPVLLLLAGLAVASLVDAAGPTEGAAAGAAVAVGYVVLAVVGALLASYSVGGGTIAPDLVTATLLAGLAYPLVFGAVGGAIAGAVR